MESKWPMVQLKDVLEQNTTTEELDPDKIYRLLGVRLEGKGPFIREEKYGSQIRAHRLRKVKAGEFIYSRLFAWRGAFGLISPEMDGAFVSNEFPTFKIDDTQIYPKFLEFYFKQKWVWDIVERYCMGTTKASRNRFKEKFFVNLEIPLPPLEEQKRIVARIESLTSRIEEARRLRAEAVREAEEFLKEEQKKVFFSLFQYWPTERLGNLVKISSGINLTSSQMEDSGKYFVYGGGGIAGRYNQYMFEDKMIGIGRVGARCGCVFITKPKSWITDNALYIKQFSNILDFYYLAKSLDNLDLRQQAKQSAQPVVSQKKIKSQKIPLPPLPVQRRIVAYLDSLQAKVDELKRLQAETEKEMEELIPSILDKAFKGEL